MNKVITDQFLFTLHFVVAIGGGTGFVPKTHIFDWPEGTRIWRKYTKLRMQLLPYIYTQAVIAHEVRQVTIVTLTLNMRHYPFYTNRQVSL